jgi:hypothetical protein
MINGYLLIYPFKELGVYVVMRIPPCAAVRPRKLGNSGSMVLIKSNDDLLYPKVAGFKKMNNGNIPSMDGPDIFLRIVWGIESNGIFAKSSHRLVNAMMFPRP